MIAQLDKEYILSRPAKIFPRLLSYFFYEGRPATTKGRWFNPVTFSALRNASRGSITESSESPVFIIGTGRSGTTILGKILSLHPDVGFLNEPKALWFIANDRDDVTGSYSNGPADYIMDHNHFSAGMAHKIKAMYSSYLISTGSSCILDKYPEMIFRVEMLNAVFKNPRFIFLFRDAFDTIASTSAWSRMHERKNEDWWGVNKRKWNLLTGQVLPHSEILAASENVIRKFSSGNDMAAVEWILTMESGIKMLQRYPDRILPVSYEELCRNPEFTFQKITAFAGWRADKKMIDYAVRTLRNIPAKAKPVLNEILIPPIEFLAKKLETLHLPDTSNAE